MKQQIYPEMSRKERKEAMKKACYRVEYEVYQAPLPTDELSAEQDAYSRRAIELQKLKKELADYNKKKKAELKAIEEEMAVQLEVINTGQREIEGNLYMFQDLQTNDMNYFDANGMWVRSRKIRPEERQTTMSIGASDIAVSDEEREDQETEEGHAVDVTETAGVIGNGPMGSEYAAMGADNQEAPAHTLEDEGGPQAETLERPDDAHPGEKIEEPETDSKQEEAQAKMDAHKRNKNRMSKKATDALAAALVPGKDNPDAGDAQVDPMVTGDEDFDLPK